VREIHAPLLGKCGVRIMMQYKGYTGVITDLDDTQGIIHGEVYGITDVITFQGKTSEELVQAFHDSVEDYLAFCEERSEPPTKPFSGRFLVRILPSLHSRVSLAASKAGKSLNTWVTDAIKSYLSKETRSSGAPRPPQQPQTPPLPQHSRRI
jgi:predicted HicB family RNase H-like nuclease